MSEVYTLIQEVEFLDFIFLFFPEVVLPQRCYHQATKFFSPQGALSLGVFE